MTTPSAGAIPWRRTLTFDSLEHPVLGPLSRPHWDRLHRMHRAHHLSFVWPGQADLG